MEYKVVYHNPHYINLDSTKNNYIADEAGTLELNLQFNTQQVFSKIKELVFKNFCIRYGDIRVLYKDYVDFEHEGESVEMSFILKGSYNLHTYSDIGPSCNKENTHSISYCHNMHGYLDWLKEDNFIFEISLSPSLFIKYLPNSNFYEHFKNNLLKHKTSSLFKSPMQITPAQWQAINQIINCKYSGHLRALFIESKVMSIILLQIEQLELCNLLNMHKAQLINKHIRDQMYYAKEIIENNIETPLSLSQLSAALNTNECSLKKNFKAIFGITVFGYVKQLKMEEAKCAILNSTKNIKQISASLGYKNPQHFSSAFKKYWGVSPNGLI